MTTRWEDLAARARGLATHLLSRVELDHLARASDLENLGDALRARGFLLPDGPVTADSLELAVRRRAAANLRTLARWARGRNALLAVLFEEEDRRSLRAIIRGALAGTPAETRLSGVIPTPGLPERALLELARQPTPGAVATLLSAWGNLYGPGLLLAARATQPDLLALEYALTTTFAARALQSARAAHDRGLLTYVRETIDLENAGAALVLAGTEQDRPARQAFVNGGRRLSLATFLEAAGSRDTAAAGRLLARAFQPASIAGVFGRTATAPAGIEVAVLSHRIAAQRGVARHDPAGLASILGFVLRLRVEALDLRRVIWGVMLSAPRQEIATALGVV